VKRPSSKRCAGCQRLQAKTAALQAEIAALRATVAELQEKLASAHKNSRTSSKPPSSDIVKPPPPPAPEGQSQRTIGGQPGHEPHFRALLPEELVDGGVFEHVPEICPDCGHGLQATGWARPAVQQFDIETVPIHIVEHRSVAGLCPVCNQLHYGVLPSGIERGGMVGPRLATVIAYLKGVCHASYATVRKFLRDVVGVSLSRSLLSKVINKVSEALAEPYEELLRDLSSQPSVNTDETGHRECGQQWWTWCFRARLYTLFKIAPTRSAEVLVEVLGQEFNGVLGCDYFSSYRKYMRDCGIVVQFCLAHLIRDVKFLTTLPDARDRGFGEQLREALRQLFEVIHCRETLKPEFFQARLQASRDRILAMARAAPPTRHSQNLAKRFAKHGQAYFEFITTPGIEPTNNRAEQAIRFVVIDRLITQGTRSEKGRNWCERIWTVVASCAQQDRSVFAFVEAAVTAWFEQTPPPTLLPTES
jgi:transposase